jgi:hypothetical protein
MALYQLTLFYPKLKEHAALVESIRNGVESIAGAHWRVLSAGEQTCAIGFATELSQDVILARLGRLDRDVHFQFLLVQVAAITGGYLSEGTLQWLKSHRKA